MNNTVNKVVTLDGIDLAYCTAGYGAKAVLFIHGNSCCKEVFEHQFAALDPAVYTVIAVDLPGHGASSDAPDPAAQYTVPAYARLMLKLLAQMDIEAPVVIGWSLGGVIALEMLGQGAVLGGVLITGTPPVGPGAAGFTEAYDESVFESAALQSEVSESIMQQFLIEIYGTYQPVPQTLVDAGFRADPNARAVMGEHWLSGREGKQQRETAEQWAGKIAVIHGDKDPYIRLDYLQSIAWKNLWQSQVHRMRSSGHAPFLEHPQEFNAHLLAFLQDTP